MHFTPELARRALLNALTLSGMMSVFMTEHHAGIGPEPRA